MIHYELYVVISCMVLLIVLAIATVEMHKSIAKILWSLYILNFIFVICVSYSWTSHYEAYQTTAFKVEDKIVFIDDTGELKELTDDNCKDPDLVSCIKYKNHLFFFSGYRNFIGINNE